MLMMCRPISSTNRVREANGQPPATEAGSEAGSSAMANGNVRSLSMSGWPSRSRPRLAEVRAMLCQSKSLSKKVVHSAFKSCQEGCVTAMRTLTDGSGASGKSKPTVVKGVSSREGPQFKEAGLSGKPNGVPAMRLKKSVEDHVGPRKVRHLSGVKDCGLWRF
jgi:hypothetical protein